MFFIIRRILADLDLLLNTKNSARLHGVLTVLPADYASAIADAGHTLAQVPQLTHFEASISRCPSFSLIAPTGQSGSQVPQFTQVPASIL